MTKRNQKTVDETTVEINETENVSDIETVESQLSEQQSAAIEVSNEHVEDASEHVGDIEVVSEDNSVVSGTSEAEVSEDNSGSSNEDNSGTSEAEIADPMKSLNEAEEMPQSEMFATYAEMYANDDCNEEDLRQAVEKNEITLEEYNLICSIPYEESEESKEAKRGIGDNKPMDETEERLFNAMSHFHPTVGNLDEARNSLVEVINERLETETRLETSLWARQSIAYANWLYYNTDGVAPNGQRIIKVHAKMYDDTLKAVTSIFPVEYITPSFKVQNASAIKAGILIMAGKLQVGYFVLPNDRRIVGPKDVALPVNPESVPEGHKVLSGVCIADFLQSPELALPNAGKIVKWVDNSKSTDLYRCPLPAVDWLYQSLFDTAGQLSYNHPEIGAPYLEGETGKLQGFETGAQVADRMAKAQAKAEATAREQLLKTAAEKLKAGEIDEEGYETLTGAKPPIDESEETERRETGGIPANAEASSMHVSTLNTWVNSTKDVPAEIKEALAAIIRENYQMRQRVSTLAEERGDDILAALSAIGEVIRSKGLPRNRQIELSDDFNSMVRRVSMPAAKMLDRDQVLALVRVKRSLEFIDDMDDDVVIVRDIDGTAVNTFKNISI